MRQVVALMAVFLAVQLASSLASSKVLLISDVDDTLKVSHVLYTTDMLARATDFKTPFAGMSQLYQLIINSDPANVVVYISNAQESILGSPIMRQSHERFLAYNQFPKGELILKQNASIAENKLTKIRQQLIKEKPDQVIFVGDNGESDAEIYHQITLENKNSNIYFTTFIHQLYSAKSSKLFGEQGKRLAPEQIGFVTPVEVALELQRENILSQQSVAWMIQNIAGLIASEPRFKTDSGRPLTFPTYVNCRDFTWRWDVTTELQPLVQKLKQRCN
ncbi:MAG: DUF2183 domain-containing protein [Bdellovibrionaceae bacterium]|nr:DUF2183 domain-containing protein [Bdellovibrio sp.]